MNTYIKIAAAFLENDCLSYGELVKKTGLSRRTLSKILEELVMKGLLEKIAFSRKKVFYACLDSYNLDLMMRWDWHRWGRPALEEYMKQRERGVDGVEEAEGGLYFFYSLALSHPRAYVGIEGGRVVLYLDQNNKILLDTENFLAEMERGWGVAFTNKDLFEGKWIDAGVASEQVKAKARLVEDHYTGARKYFVPPILPKMNLCRCLEAGGRAYGFLIGSKKDFERWGIEVKRDSVGYYFENPERVREIKDYFKKAYNEYSRKETINKISALAYLLWLNREKLRPYATNEPIVV